MFEKISSYFAPQEIVPARKNLYALARTASAFQKDTLAPCDKQEDLFFKKFDARRDQPFFGIPRLASPSLTDSHVDKAVFDALHTQRISYNFTLNLNHEEVRHKQHHQKLLHQDKDRLMGEIAERASTSNQLGSAQIGLAVGTIFLSVLGVAATLLTGGAAAVVLGGLGAIVGGTQSVVGGINGFHDLKTTEISGLVQENKMLHDHQHSKVKNILDDGQMTTKQQAHLNASIVTILKNQSRNRMGG